MNKRIVKEFILPLFAYTVPILGTLIFLIIWFITLPADFFIGFTAFYSMWFVSVFMAPIYLSILTYRFVKNEYLKYGTTLILSFMSYYGGLFLFFWSMLTQSGYFSNPNYMQTLLPRFSMFIGTVVFSISMFIAWGILNKDN